MFADAAPHAVQFNVDHALPVAFTGVGCGAARAFPTGIVERTIEPAEAFKRGGDDGLDLFERADVGPGEKRIAAGPANFFGYILAVVNVAATDDNRRAFGCKAQGCGTPDAAGAAKDQGDPVRKSMLGHLIVSPVQCVHSQRYSHVNRRLGKVAI